MLESNYELGLWRTTKIIFGRTILKRIFKTVSLKVNKNIFIGYGLKKQYFWKCKYLENKFTGTHDRGVWLFCGLLYRVDICAMERICYKFCDFIIAIFKIRLHLNLALATFLLLMLDWMLWKTGHIIYRRKPFSLITRTSCHTWMVTWKLQFQVSYCSFPFVNKIVQPSCKRLNLEY